MKRVLFVCTGNICRSPTAEGVARHFIERGGLGGLIEVDSAGTQHYHVGEAPDPRTQKAAARRGYDLSALRARKLELEDFARFDLLLAMDREHLRIMNRLRPEASRARVGLFTVLGGSAAISVHMLLVCVGLVSLMATLGHWMEFIRWAGVAYLLWLGWRAWMAGDGDESVAPTARDARRDGPRADLIPLVYLSAAQPEAYSARTRLSEVALRTAGADPRGLLPALQRAVWSIDPAQPITNVLTLDEVIAGSTAERRFNMMLLSAAKTWRFDPARRNGTPVKYRVRMNWVTR